MYLLKIWDDEFDNMKVAKDKATLIKYVKTTWGDDFSKFEFRPLSYEMLIIYADDSEVGMIGPVEVIIK